MRRRLALLILFSAFIPTSSSAEVAPEFVREWGGFCNVAIDDNGNGDNGNGDNGNGDNCEGKFNEPYGIAVGPDGFVYVADTVNHRIQKFDSDGNLIHMWGSMGSANGQFLDPVGLGFDGSGNIYVAEFSGHRVQKFGSDGSHIWTRGSFGTGDGQFHHADDVAVDKNGIVYVADKKNHRIQRFNTDGDFLSKWGIQGAADGQLNLPVGVAVDSDVNVFVAEQGNHRIQKFDTNGVFIANWGSLGSGDDQLNEPIHINVDASGNVYVPDSKNHRIMKFDGNGTLLTQWGFSGTGEGQFMEPEGVAVDDLTGCIYVADTQNHRVQKFARVAPQPCAPCPPLPASQTANFRVGDPVSVGGARYEIPLFVDTPEMITFSQMTVEYDDACLSFVSAAIGGDVTNPGPVTANPEAGATDPDLNRHVTVNATGEYGGDCDFEVFVLTFDLVGSLPCRVVWDRSTPPGNPPNHLNTSGGFQIKGSSLSFCDLDFDCLTSFTVGDAVPVGTGTIEVPLLVSTTESITFSQMTILYDPACVLFVSAQIGSGVMNAGPVTENDDGAGRVSVNATGDYGPGTDIEVFRFTFSIVDAGLLPCPLTWDRSSPPSNPPNHLITSEPALIPPTSICFVDGVATNECDDVQVSGTVMYFQNGADILPGIPDATSDAVTVQDCNNAGNSTTANDATYSLPFGPGPHSTICICASRPKADCDLFEGGVISGDDLILVEDIIAGIVVATPKQEIAADVNKDNMILTTDRDAIARWIAKTDVCDVTTCSNPGNNCTGTWRFVFPTGGGPSDFDIDMRCLDNVCTSQIVDIQGVLLGDVDCSWPNIFPKPLKQSIVLTLEEIDRKEDVLTLGLSAELLAEDALHHVVYSLDYDSAAFEYLGARVGDRANHWGLFDNPAEQGVAHGIAHRRGGMQPIKESGQILRFRFRALKSDTGSRFSFSRLRANGLAVEDVGVGNSAALNTATPAHYSLRAYPNPFNPSARLQFVIPETAGRVPVALRVYDIGGHLIRTLITESRGPGKHEIVWNGEDDHGKTLGAGIYVLRIEAGDWSEIHKMALIK